MDARQMLAYRTGRTFIEAIVQMTQAHPHPDGNTVRVTVASVIDGNYIGGVDIDVTNLWVLANAAQPDVAPAAVGWEKRPRLRLVRGEAE